MLESKKAHVRRNAWRGRRARKPRKRTAVSSRSDSSEPSQRGEEPGSLVGVCSLVLGAAVGVGVLALPERVEQSGFAASTVVDLLPMFGLLLCNAISIVEVNAEMLQQDLQSGKPMRTVTLTEMARRAFGPLAADATSVVYFLLGGALIISYVDKAGSTLSAFLPWLHLSPGFAGPCFAVSLATLIAFGGVNAADSINRVGTISLLASYVVLVSACALSSDPSLLLQPPRSWAEPISSLPTAFLCLSFHDTLPPIFAEYAKGDVALMRRAIIISATAAVLLFVVWDAAALSQFSQGFRIELLEQSSNPLVSLGSELFALAALSTSFCTGYLGLSEATRSTVIKSYTRVSGGNEPSRGVQNATIAIVLLSVPLIVDEVFPGLFMRLSSQAGGYGQALLWGVGAPAVSLRMEKTDGSVRTISNSKPLAVFLLLISGGVIVSQALTDLNVL